MLFSFTLIAFALLSAVRIFAYLPQIISVARDCAGARGVSLTTWILFAGSNCSTSAYAVVETGDWNIACVYALNTLSCVVIVCITGWKRLQYRIDLHEQGHAPTPRVPLPRPMTERGSSKATFEATPSG